MDEKGGAFLKVLSAFGRCLPGERFKTSVYLNCIVAPRRALREAATGFYRMDHIYEVLREFGDHYDGQFSILEFGVADGYSFTKKLFATEYLGMADRVMVQWLRYVQRSAGVGRQERGGPGRRRELGPRRLPWSL
jgi:hypothetical protein